ncbi:MAG: DUF177 domain-containing protein [Pseudomonadota bacterium]
MIIDLQKITSKPQAYRFTLEREWWRPEGHDDRILFFEKPLEVRVSLYKAGDRFVLEGKLDGVLEAQCDRCLDPFSRVLDAAFRVFFARPLKGTAKTDVEILDEDVEVDFVRDEEVELDGIIREQVYLSLPIKCLCSDRCAGLCPSCGGNLNKGECKCRREHGHPAFAKLKNLKKRKVDHRSELLLMKKPH